MPNWCANRITVSGDPKDVSALVALVTRDAEDAFSFDRIIPMPKILQTVGEGQRSFEVDGESVTLKTWFERRDDRYKIIEARPFTGDEAAALDRIGYSSWYDWRRDHWGCKWPASHIEVMTLGEDYAEWRFDTPWSPPEPIIDHLRSRFPECHITAFYDEPGMMVAGYY